MLAILYINHCIPFSPLTVVAAASGSGSGSRGEGMVSSMQPNHAQVQMELSGFSNCLGSLILNSPRSDTSP